MDARTNMIIAKGKPVSSDVINCEFNALTKKWDITFKNGKTYPYGAQNVTFLKDPVSLKPHNYQVRYEGKLLDNISAIFAFKGAGKEYWHICFSNAYEHDYCLDELEISKSVLDHFGAKQVFEYLREVASCVSVRTEDDTAILTKQYEKINYVSDETVAAIYLNPDEYQSGTDLDSTAPIFPFGCNASQYEAVCNALANRISVIEGPPGTGKTQTILNIIANLVLQGKTVQIVSNNNSAIDNIIEKMASAQYKVDFIVAQLGNEQRKQKFVNSQTGVYPDLSAWESSEYDSSEFLACLQEKSRELQEVFRDKNLLAELKQELHTIQLEQEHYNGMVADKDLFVSKKTISSEKLMEFWQEYQDIQEGNKRAGLIYRIVRYFSHGISIRQLLKRNPSDVLNKLQGLYYNVKIDEIQSKIVAIEDKLASIDADTMMKAFTEMSMKCFRSRLAKRYDYKSERIVFPLDALWKDPNEFLKEYPVVLSTTYTARSSLGKSAQFDYIIMDEASQVDVATGTLAVSCAKNAVIVGDTKQLPNVVTSLQKNQMDYIFGKHRIPKSYDFTENSFLKSLCTLLVDRVPKITLCEHYRCHPQIIGFCNEKFYQGKLIVMTDQDSTSALQLVTTVAGKHERNHMNLRQIEVIRKEILPKLNYSKNQIGIIAPYRNQVLELIKELADPEIEIATVHKFQGREKDVIILSTVDDIVTEFSDDPNLLNVAVSRAKKKLIIVTADQEQPVGSNVGDLIGYIRYNNCDVQHSEISSVFDFLYDQYAESRRKYLEKHKRISEFDSENLMYGLILEELERRDDAALGVICHQHLNRLFRDLSRMNIEEQRFVNTGLSHLDFLVFNRVSKVPLLAIEVDGFLYHKEGTKQAERDKLKNHILAMYGIPLLRFKTNGSGERQRLSAELDRILC